MESGRGIVLTFCLLVFVAFVGVRGERESWREEKVLIIDMEAEHDISEFDPIQSAHRSYEVRSDPSDPLYDKSWHLHPLTASSKGSLNVEEAWMRGYTGKDVIIGYPPDAPYVHHLELKDRALSFGASGTYSLSKTAIIAAAVANANNNICSRGVAYDSRYLVLGDDKKSLIDYDWMNDENVASAHILVVDYGVNRTYCPRCWEKAKEVVSSNKNQKIIITSTGNLGGEENCNDFMYTNSPFAISVAPHTIEGRRSSFSQPCANALVSVPCGDKQIGITTAASPPSECTTVGGGFLAPSIAAGVVALIMEASDRKLTYREVAHILVESADKPNSQMDGQWSTNGAGLMVNNLLGFGNVNAGKAVLMAKNRLDWTRFVNRGTIQHKNTQRSYIADLSQVTISLPISVSSPTLRLDWATLELELDHTFSMDLQITLTSPAGTQSVLATAKNRTAGDKFLTVITQNMESSRMIYYTAMNEAAEQVPEGYVGKWRFIEIVSDCCDKSKCRMYHPSSSDPSLHIALLIWSDDITYCTLPELLQNVMYPEQPGQSTPDMIFFEGEMVLETNVTTPVFGIPKEDMRYFISEIHAQEFFDFNFKSRPIKASRKMTRWAYTTVRHWHETVDGVWSLNIADKVPRDSGTYNSAVLTLYTYEVSDAPAPSPSPDAVPLSNPHPTPSRIVPKPHPVPHATPKPTPLMTPVKPTPTPTPYIPSPPTPAPSVRCCWYKLLKGNANKCSYVSVTSSCPAIPDGTIQAEFISKTTSKCFDICGE